MNNFNNTNSEFDTDLLGFFDPTTQIASRKKFDTMLAQEFARAKNTISYLSLLLVEIDYFKNYVKTNDPQIEEHCLREVAFSLKKLFKRSGDLVARWGDAEFICLLTDTDATGANKMGAAVKKTIAELNIPYHDSPVADIVTVSIGGATALLTDDTSSDELITKVERALARARKMGRNQFIEWNE